MNIEISKNEFNELNSLHKNQIKGHYYTNAIYVFRDKDGQVWTQVYSHPSYHLQSIWYNSKIDQFFK